MKKYKIPALIFAAVFVISAAALIFYVKKDLSEKSGEDVEAPAWVKKEGSSGKLPITSKVARSGNELTPKPEKREAETPPPPALPIKEETTTLPAKTTTAENTTAQEPLEKAVELIRDAFVNEIFLDNLANYVADNYHPAGTLPYRAKQGFSTATLKGINMHFGLNLRGLMPEAENLVTARKSIWEYLLAPGKLEAMSKTETGPLLDLIEEKGILAERNFMEGDTASPRALTREQRAEMFRTSAAPLRHVSAVVKAITDNPDLVQALDSYFKAGKRVDSANGIFQLDLDQARNLKTESAKSKAARSGKILKDAITIREKIKTGIIRKIHGYCSGPCETPDDAFYIAKWVFRRVHDDEKRLKEIASGSNVLNSIADAMLERADAIEKSM